MKKFFETNSIILELKHAISILHSAIKTSIANRP